MGYLQNTLDKLRQKSKYSASNPANFEVLWSFQATRIQLFSLIFIFILLVGALSTLLVLKGPFSGYFSKNDVSIERKKLEEQHNQLIDLTKKISAQEKYIQTIRLIIDGKVPEDTTASKLPEVIDIETSELNSDATENEILLAKKVKDDLRSTKAQKIDKNVPYFSSPAKGVISQGFDLKEHPAIDIIVPKDKTILACLAGTVVYSGYTQKDGFIMILDHANGYLSVYKHNKTVLKKTGSRVQMNDPIAIAGNSGENTSGPHLHFELWYNQSAVNPEDYMSFK
jgi:murein DD-endopeptidase MepM/ murein hydrolase activator NlpD